MTDWSKVLRAHANNLERAAKAFEEFCGTDSEEHAENLQDAAVQFRKDATEYEETV